MKFQLPDGVALVPFKAGLAATGLGSILGAVCLATAGFAGQPTTGGVFVEAALALSFYGFVFALPVVFLYGLPLFSIFRMLKIANFGTGIFFGALPGIIWVLRVDGEWVNPVLWNGVLIAIFYVALRRRDKTYSANVGTVIPPKPRGSAET